jgi:hypothetical protein
VGKRPKKGGKFQTSLENCFLYYNFIIFILDKFTPQSTVQDSRDVRCKKPLQTTEIFLQIRVQIFLQRNTSAPTDKRTTFINNNKIRTPDEIKMYIIRSLQLWAGDKRTKDLVLNDKNNHET